MTATLFNRREASAEFSDCPVCRVRVGHDGTCFRGHPALYRYVLRVPTGVDNDSIALFVLANPSTAVPDKLDPTVTRCKGWAELWGYGWCFVVNFDAWRETDPKRVPRDGSERGPLNDEWIIASIWKADLIIIGCGRLVHPDRVVALLRVVRDCSKTPHALRLLSDGTPCHPLARGKAALPRELWPVAIGGAA